MLDKIIELDYLWFYFIHFEWSNKFFDYLLPFIRNQFFWVPLYLFLLLFMLINYRRKGAYWCLGYLVAFGITDYTCSSIIKPWVQRLRPCRDEAFVDAIQTLVHCGSGYSFPSSHAANHFAMSVFIAITLGRKKPWVWTLAILWAVGVAFAQIYVGVHFPFDTIAGALLGLIIGSLIATLFTKLIKWNVC